MDYISSDSEEKRDELISIIDELVTQNIHNKTYTHIKNVDVVNNCNNFMKILRLLRRECNKENFDQKIKDLIEIDKKILQNYLDSH